MNGVWISGEFILVSTIEGIVHERNRLRTDYAEIQQLRDAELSHIYQLREHLKALSKRYNCSEHICEPINKLLEENPEQSVAHIQADALRSFALKARGCALAGTTWDSSLMIEADRLEREAGL